MTDKETFYKALGSKIREQREVVGLTQAQLANAVGLSRTSVTNIELGRQRLMLDQFESICAAVGKTAGDVLGSAQTPVVETRNAHDLGTLPSVQNFVRELKQAKGKER